MGNDVAGSFSPRIGRIGLACVLVATLFPALAAAQPAPPVEPANPDDDKG